MKYIIFLFFSMTFGCKMAETISSQHQLLLYVPNSSKIDSIEILGGSKKLLNLKPKNIWQINLNGVGGGYSEMFGTKFNEVDGDKEDRLYFYHKMALITSYSYTEIIKLDFEMVDTMKVFILNKDGIE
jgi:hypothetical protein